MNEAKRLLTVPESFIKTAMAFPDKVDQALALLDNVKDVSELLAKADTMEHYAKRIRVDNKLIKPIQYGRLKIIAKLGGLLTRDTKRGRGKKSPLPTQGLSLASDTLSAYRKVSDHVGKLDDYYRDALADDDAEMGIAGFVRYVGSDGNIKSHQNKGVIEWYTPEPYIEAARQTMGSIDLDPASNRKAQKIVKAGTFYSKDDDGLVLEWSGTVFLNPPFKADLAKAFVSKLCKHINDNTVCQAILLTNNNTDTQWWHEAAELCDAICFTKGRINFYSPAGEIAQPTNGHTIFYFGKRIGSFVKEHSKFGVIMGRQ